MLWVEVTFMGGPLEGPKMSPGCPEVICRDVIDPEKNTWRVAVYDRIPDAPIYQFRGWKDEGDERGF